MRSRGQPPPRAAHFDGEGTFIVNRLDLDDTHVRMAREAGVPLIISTDSHATTHLLGIHWGVSQARRGWAEAKDVANTLPASAFLAKFGHHHDRG